MSARIKILLVVGCLALSALMLPDGVEVLAQTRRATTADAGTSPWAGGVAPRGTEARFVDRVARVPFDLELRQGKGTR